jgi:hypothetical protein
MLLPPILFIFAREIAKIVVALTEATTRMALWGVKLFNFSPSSVFSEWWAMNGHYFRRSTVLVLGLVIVSVLWFVLCSRSDAMGGALPAESEGSSFMYSCIFVYHRYVEK